MSRIGPCLPPHLEKARQEDSSDSEGETLGPRLPSVACRGPAPPLAPSLGPALPPGQGDPEQTSSSEDEYGPALPPGLAVATAPRSLAQPQTQKAQNEDSDTSEDDEATIGPRVQEMGAGPTSAYTAAKEIEARANAMKDKLEGKLDQGVVKRETWMLELPEEKADRFGLGPRQFSRKGVSEKGKDRSKWTDTPEEKARKLALGIGDHVEEENKEEVDFDRVVTHQRDQAMEKVAEELRQKRGTDSLMNLHDKKLKKKKKEDADDGIVKERRPFDRDTDLQANQFDAAAKKAMLKKAAKINDRFSAGVQKFL